MQYYYSRINDNITTRIYYLSETVVRIHRSIDNDRKPSPLPILMNHDPDSKPISAYHEMEEDGPPYGSDYYSNPIDNNRFMQVFINREGAIFCSPPGRNISFREIVGRHILENEYGVVHSFCLDDSLFYGFGEKTGPLEKRGQRMRFRGKDACGYDPQHTDPLYKSLPFFIKMDPQGKDFLGIFYHTAGECEIDLGREVNGYYPPMGQFITREKEIDLFLIYGKCMAQVLDHFTELTGRPAMLPKYALGYLGSTMYYTELPENCDREILDFVQKSRKMGMSCSNFQLSSGYTADEKGRRNVFSWNRKKFPDPGAFIRQMRELGVTVTPNVKPAMLTTNPLYQEFAQAGAFIQTHLGTPYVTRFWGGEGSFVDFTNPVARKLWKKHLHEQLFRYGIHSLWNDNNEFDVEGGICCNEGNPRPAAEMRAVLPLLMARTGQEALEEAFPYLRPYQVSRSGCAGINRYAQVWTGDNRTSWESLKWNIATMLGSGMSGMPLTGSDVGGFAGGAPEKELLLRWIALGAVMPRFCIHSCNDDNTVTEPWMYESAVPAVQRFFRLRQQLMPYLYSLHYASHKNGTPIWQPMVWQHPGDRRCQQENVDFFIGNALLCAPVVEKGAKERKIWLPHGEIFYDICTGNRYEGGQEITLQAPLDRLILLQKQGTLFPTQEADGLHLWITQPVENETHGFTYYDDDGLYQQERFAMESELDLWPWGDLELHQNILRGTLRWQVELRCNGKAPATVTADEAPLNRYMDYDRLKAAGMGWYYDMEHHLARILPGDFKKLQVQFDTIDLIKMDTE